MFSSGNSLPFIVTGIDGPTTISLTGNNEITSYSINGGQFITEPSVVNNGDVIVINLGTGSQYATLYTDKVTIGGISKNFTISTKAFTNGLEEKNRQSLLSLYPNPTSGIVTIDGIQENGKLVLFNVMGQLVKSEIVDQLGSFKLNIAAFNAGIYFVKYYTNSKVYAGQIILK